LQGKAKSGFVLGWPGFFYREYTVMSTARDARLLMQSSTQAVLATLGQEPVAGFPLASAVPYCLDAAGRPLLLISRLARHTQHVRQDDRVSLLVQGQGSDIQASPRISIAGHLEPLPEAEIDDAAGRYYRFFAQTRDFHRIYDFSFWRLQPVRAHFIAGFAKVAWVEGPDLLAANPFDRATETDMVQHMNDDHADALPLYCRQAGVAVPEGAAPVMTGIDADGFHLRLSDRIVYIRFPRPVSTPLEVRQTLVALLKSARTGENPQ
jgi:putative heme iron utilization protein